MEKHTLQAIIAFLLMGTILSFSSLLIFQLKVNQNTDKVIENLSVLTDANALEWGATPGIRNIKMINTFDVFNYDGISFKMPNEPLTYQLRQELTNRTYIPSVIQYTYHQSPGYINYMPSFWLEAEETVGDVSSSITGINLVAAQNFYKQVNMPMMMKLPRYFNIMVRALQQDFLNYYFTHTIYEFYTKDKQDVKISIFDMANIEESKQDILWNDPVYGWKSVTTFKDWVKASENKNGNQLMEYFQLTEKQLEILIGPKSIITKLRKLINQAVSDGIVSLRRGGCKQALCSNWELAIAQWGFGALTAQQFVPPVTIQEGGYSNFNDSIPITSETSQFEYYLGAPALQFAEVMGLLQERYEEEGNLLSFNTMQYVTDSIDNLDKVQYKLKLVDEKVTITMVAYLQKQMAYINSQNEVLAYESWRFMKSMMDEGATLLRNGLHAKALYKLSVTKCTTMIPFPDVCDDGTLKELDFTKSAKIALKWVEVALGGSDEQFDQLVKSLNTDETTLNNYLFGESEFTTTMNNIKSKIAQFYKCQFQTICTSVELFTRQWGTSSITAAYPPGLGFDDKDIVTGINEWDIYSDKKHITYEFSKFQKQFQVNTETTKLLHTFEMGGIFGYYSLWNLFDYNYDNKALHKNFALQGEQARLLCQYINNGLVNYWYGGLLVQSDKASYLFDYQNTYTNLKSTWSPLNGGINWKSTSSQLVRSNSDEYTHYATPDDYFSMDTGIINVKYVGQLIKTFNDKQLKAKQIMYFNDDTDYITSYYYYPNKEAVSGSYGLAFPPQCDQDTIEMFDIDIYSKISLKSVGQVEFEGFNANKYESEDQLISLQSVEGYPLYISIGKPVVQNCQLINGAPCSGFLDSIHKTSITIEEITGITVELVKSYVYWLRIDEQSPLLQAPFDKPTMIPIAIRNVEYKYNKNQMNSYFAQVQELRTDRLVYLVVFIVLGCLFAIGLIGSAIYYSKNKDKMNEPPLSIYSSFNQ